MLLLKMIGWCIAEKGPRARRSEAPVARSDARQKADIGGLAKRVSLVAIFLFGVYGCLCARLGSDRLRSLMGSGADCSTSGSAAGVGSPKSGASVVGSSWVGASRVAHSAGLFSSSPSSSGRVGEEGGDGRLRAPVAASSSSFPFSSSSPYS